MISAQTSSPRKLIFDALFRVRPYACLVFFLFFAVIGRDAAQDQQSVAPQSIEQQLKQSAQKAGRPDPASSLAQAKTPEQERARLNPKAPCIEPPQMVSWQEYHGPLQKTVGLFARRLERKSVGRVHYKPGALMCTLETKDKFRLFVLSATDPVTVLSVAFNAGVSQAEDSDRAFGEGAAGYGKRFGAAAADEASSEFFKDFAYPTIFREDPRYYPLGAGSTRRRLWHASMHAFVAHHEDGRPMFNFSEWLGTTSASSLSNLYHPGNRRGFSPTAEGVAESVGSDVGYDILREFWPEIAQKFRLPFKHQGQQ